MDNASDYGSEDSRFESWCARNSFNFSYNFQCWEEQKTDLENQLKVSLAEKSGLEIFKEEFDKLLNSLPEFDEALIVLDECDTETKQQHMQSEIGSLTRKVVTLKSNEGEMARRLAATRNNLKNLEQVNLSCWLFPPVYKM